MPRRPKKLPDHLFKPGQSGNPAGRPPGAASKIVIADRVREAFSQLLDNNVDKLEEWLYAAAKKDPVKALDLWVRISERFVPMLSRTEITGKDGEPFTPITISLPSLPTISVPTLNPGETAPIPLLESPAEETKLIGEAAPSTDVDLGKLPAFTIPKPVLSENQLRDLREMGMQPPGEGAYADDLGDGKG